MNTHSDNTDEESLVQRAALKLEQDLSREFDTHNLLSCVLRHLRPGAGRLNFARWMLETRDESSFAAMREYIISHLLCPGSVWLRESPPLATVNNETSCSFSADARLCQVAPRKLQSLQQPQTPRQTKTAQERGTNFPTILRAP